MSHGPKSHVQREEHDTSDPRVGRAVIDFRENPEHRVMVHRHSESICGLRSLLTSDGWDRPARWGPVPTCPIRECFCGRQHALCVSQTTGERKHFQTGPGWSLGTGIVSGHVSFPCTPPTRLKKSGGTLTVVSPCDSIRVNSPELVRLHCATGHQELTRRNWSLTDSGDGE